MQSLSPSESPDQKAMARILLVDDSNDQRIAELMAALGESDLLQGMEIVRSSELVANGGTRTLTVASDELIHLHARVGEDRSDQVLIVGPGGISPTLPGSITELIRNHHLCEHYIPTLSTGPAHDGLPNRDRWGKQQRPRRGHKTRKRR